MNDIRKMQLKILILLVFVFNWQYIFGFIELKSCFMYEKMCFVNINFDFRAYSYKFVSK